MAHLCSRGLVDYALNNRFLMLAMAVLLFIWGIISFKNLPIEAYPDVANNYVQIITQWPGRAAEEVEQQVTVPLEIVMNGLPHLTSLRSVSLFGLSSLNLIFDDESENDWNRAKVLERLAQVTLPAGLQPQMGTDWSPVGQIYFYTLSSSNPRYDVMELKSLEDWVIEKQFKSVPNVVDVASFGGVTREYQVRVDPDKLVSYGLNIGQVENQLSNNNTNGGGSFIEAGLQQVNVRAVGLVKTVDDIEQTVITTKNGTPIRVKDIATVIARSEDPAGAFCQGDSSGGRPRSSTTTTWCPVSCSCEKAPSRTRRLTAIHEKVKELNEHILPPGVKIVPFLDRSDLVHYTTHTVLHNLTEGIVLVAIILFLFLGNLRGAFIVALTIPFSLLFASICLDLRHIPANLLSLGALDFGMVVDGAVVMVENIVRHLNRQEADARPHERADPRGGATKCSGPYSTRSPSSLRLTSRSSRCSGWKGACSSRWPGRWRLPCSARCCSPCWSRRCLRVSCSVRAAQANGTTRFMVFLTERYRRGRELRNSPSLAHAGDSRRPALVRAVPGVRRIHRL